MNTDQTNPTDPTPAPDCPTGDTPNFIQVLRAYAEQIAPVMITDGIEIGVHRGKLSQLLLAEFPELTLAMVDPWRDLGKGSRYAKSGDGIAKLNQAQQDACRADADAVTRFAINRRLILKLTSEKAAQRLAPNRLYDFVFIDGDHSYEGVLQDIELWWPRVRGPRVERAVDECEDCPDGVEEVDVNVPGGILGGHDHGLPRYPGVARAVAELCEREGIEFNESVNLVGSVWWVQKGAAKKQ